MRHPVLDQLGSLQWANDDALEYAVDALISESEGGYWSDPSIELQVARAEALAILSHEFRRRATRGEPPELVRFVDPEPDAHGEGEAG